MTAETDTGSVASGECPVAHMFDIKTPTLVEQVLRSNVAWLTADLYCHNMHTEDPWRDHHAREHMDDTLITLNGHKHSERRRVLNALVRPDALARLQHEVMIPATQRQLARFLAAPDQDGRYRIDLCELLNRIFVQFVAGLIGLSGTETDEGLDELASCAQPISDAFNSQFIEDSKHVLRLGLEAKQRYVTKFYEPSRQKYLDMLKEVEAGRLSEDDIPLTLMRLLVTHANPDYQDENVAVRESCMMFAGGGGTSVQAICWTISELERWFERNPDQRHLATDQTFLSSALEEAMRLKAPFMPCTERILAEDAVIGDQKFEKGQELRVHLTRASRDPEVYGPDAAEFNAFRKVDADVPRYGFGFARGRHQCFGLRIVLGTDDSSGAHGSVLKALYDAGVRRDPDRTPERLPMRKEEYSIPDQDAFWHTFPVEFTNWKPATEPK